MGFGLHVDAMRPAAHLYASIAAVPPSEPSPRSAEATTAQVPSTTIAALPPEKSAPPTSTANETAVASTSSPKPAASSQPAPSQPSAPPQEATAAAENAAVGPPAAPPDDDDAALPVPTLPAEALASRRNADQTLPGADGDASPRSLLDDAAATAPPASEQSAVKSGLNGLAILSEKAPPGEAEFVARADALIAPVRNADPTSDDATRLREAMGSVARPDAARALRDRLTDPVARRLVDWALVRAGRASAAEIRAFLEASPNWPNRELITQRMEEQTFMAGGSAKDIKAFYAASPPKTGIGRAALASAHLAEGNEPEARALAVPAWRKGEIPASLEVGFLERFGKLLTEADHKARFDNYLVDSSRWANQRSSRAAVARRLLPLLGDAERKKAAVRLAVYLRQPGTDPLMAALPKDAATVPTADWGFVFQLVQWHRRANRDDAAWKLLKSVPTTAEEATNLDEWWEERRGAAYDALKAGKPDLAYDLVKAPGDLGVDAKKDQAFLAGFLALRHLKNARAAEQHFLELESAADGPLSRGKAGFWLARTYEALKDEPKQKAALERAAKNWDTFYGQIARQKLEPGLRALDVKTPDLPDAATAAAFNTNELVRAVVLGRKAGIEPHVLRVFLIRLAQDFKTEGELALTAHLAEAIGDTQMAVRIGKSAIARGFQLAHYAYPIHAMPQFQPLRPPPETALMLAIARQESEFNNRILSGAGARGLMQVMPITAQHVCKDFKIKCEIDRLTSDPAYNLMIAAAYIGDRMDEFKGSYVLTIAGYNAGPGRARQWIREFGDPRTKAVDPIDWIHRIPFEETREYVQKVLSNTQVYRARLGAAETALQMSTDLRREAKAKTSTPPPVRSE